MSALNDVLILANSADPGEMQHHAAFIWIFIVYQCTRLEVSSKAWPEEKFKK